MSTPEHVYISGPMRGHDDYNFPAFFEAEESVLRRFPEAEVHNPAREDVVRFNLRQCLATDRSGRTAGRYLASNPEVFGQTDLRVALGADLDYICSTCDLIVMLPGWEASKGATAELAAAKALGVPVAFLEPPRPVPAAPVADSEPPVSLETAEVRSTSASGGQKGVKLAQFDQIPPSTLWRLAEHFGRGARKYSAHNFRKGYEWSKSYNALLRHLTAFWGGEDYDNHTPDCEPGCVEHTGSHHLDAVMWHAHVLRNFYDEHPEYDDRYRVREDD